MEINFGGFDLPFLLRILDATDKCLNALLEMDENPEPLRQGGYFTLRDGTTNDILFAIKVGSVPPEKRMKYYHLSLEKGDRLFKTQRRHERHVTSSESRNPEKNQYGGAIITVERKPPYILSFSGLTEDADEALMASVAIKLGWLSPKWAHMMANAYRNTTYKQLQKALT